MLAYLDANTGSVILAAFAGGLAGLAVLLKLYWNRILGLFSTKRSARAEELRTDLVGSDEAAD